MKAYEVISSQISTQVIFLITQSANSSSLAYRSFIHSFFLVTHKMPCKEEQDPISHLR